MYGTLAPESERVILTLLDKMKKAHGGRVPTESCARLRIQLAILKATSSCIRSRSRDTPKFGAPADRAQEAEIEEEEEPLDLEAEWGDLRTSLGE